MGETHGHSRESGLDGKRRPHRLRHDLRFRLLEVRAAERLTPHMMRITLGGAELEGFHSPGFDDHVKLFFPALGEDAPPRPEFGGNGLSFPEGSARPVARDYTPRFHDPVAGTLQIDFALHDSGPASNWARQAAPGQVLGIGGPRGSFILPVAFDWHLLIGDATALPAIARRLAELPAGAQVLVLAEVEDAADELVLETAAAAAIRWVHRARTAPGCDPLVEALRGATFPEGDYHAWIGCESATAKTLRQILVAERGANPAWIRASGYWRRGAVGAHDSFDE